MVKEEEEEEGRKEGMLKIKYKNIKKKLLGKTPEVCKVMQKMV